MGKLDYYNEYGKQWEGFADIFLLFGILVAIGLGILSIAIN